MNSCLLFAIVYSSNHVTQHPLPPEAVEVIDGILYC